MVKFFIQKEPTLWVQNIQMCFISFQYGKRLKIRRSDHLDKTWNNVLDVANWLFLMLCPFSLSLSLPIPPTYLLAVVSAELIIWFLASKCLFACTIWISWSNQILFRDLKITEGDGWPPENPWICFFYWLWTRNNTWFKILKAHVTEQSRYSPKSVSYSWRSWKWKMEVLVVVDWYLQAFSKN